MISQRRVKIIATAGPSLATKEALKSAVEAGLNVIRLNFSHGTHLDHSKTITWVRELSRELGSPLTVLQDLQGPKIRVTKFKDGFINLNPGQNVSLVPGLGVGDNQNLGIDFLKVGQSVKPGTKILLDDGLIELVVIAVNSDVVSCQVIAGGVLKDRKGVNIPGAYLPIECLTEKDLLDLDFGLSQGVDYVALSFARRGDDIIKLRDLIDRKRPDTRIIAKIEMLEALENLKEIIELSDGIMVARGDLAVEAGQERLPGIQKQIIKMCNEFGKPVITATQMLESMVTKPSPTRAEITDVANAVLDGSDALMLSAETASGAHPSKCIKVMNDIIIEVEKDSDYYHIDYDIGGNFLAYADSISASACLSARKLNAKAIICLSTSGKTAVRISTYRPKAHIIAVSELQEALNRLALVWGARSLKINPYADSEEAFAEIEASLLKYDVVKPGDTVIFTLGMPVGSKAKTNSLKILTISDRDVKPLPASELPLGFR
ncbi:MAG: pyruvate kinase [Pseudomonadota bacterium]|nr:pyruvate kinase [Pseudomonadota bacterium]